MALFTTIIQCYNSLEAVCNTTIQFAKTSQTVYNTTNLGNSASNLSNPLHTTDTYAASHTIM